MSTYLSQASLVALSEESRNLIGTFLNPPKAIPTETGLFRDWRGLLQICGIGGEILSAIAANPNPCEYIFNIVEKKSKDFTLQNLKDALEKIGRWDILDDCESLLVADTKLYLERMEKSKNTIENNFDIDAEVLTLDDQFRIERGEETQCYDAFLLYTEEDTDFALDIVKHLEEENNLKLCLKDRDLIAGITFEHTAIMTLISERCNRLIIVISPEFLKSTANKFFINFAQAVAIDKMQERKIIPCVYKNCELPLQLTYFSKIYYRRIAAEFFWNTLVCSIKAVPNLPKSQKSTRTSSDEKDGFVLNESVKVNKSGKNRKTTLISLNSIKCLTKFSWKRKSENKVNEVSNPRVKTNDIELTTLNLPTLGGLNSPTSLTGTINVTKKSEIKKEIIIGSMKELLAKSE